MVFFIASKQACFQMPCAAVSARSCSGGVPRRAKGKLQPRDEQLLRASRELALRGVR